MSSFLTRADVERITGKVKFSAMRRVLQALGIRYTLAGTGEPLVRQDWLDATTKDARNRGPNWERLNA